MKTTIQTTRITHVLNNNQKFLSTKNWYTNKDYAIKKEYAVLGKTVTSSKFPGRYDAAEAHLESKAEEFDTWDTLLFQGIMTNYVNTWVVLYYQDLSPHIFALNYHYYRKLKLPNTLRTKIDPDECRHTQKSPAYFPDRGILIRPEKIELTNAIRNLQHRWRK